MRFHLPISSLRAAALAVCLVATNAQAEGIGDLFAGVAAIIAATQPGVVAAIQAKADVKIAGINADEAKFEARTAAEVSRYQADAAAEVAFANMAAAERINEQNQKGVTDRLLLQLASLERTRKDAVEAEKMRMARQYALDQERIALARDQFLAQKQLAAATLKAQLNLSGARSGYSSANASLTIQSARGRGVPSLTNSAPPSLGGDTGLGARAPIRAAVASRKPVGLPPVATQKLLSSVLSQNGADGVRGFRSAGAGVAWKTPSSNENAGKLLAVAARGSSAETRLRVREPVTTPAPWIPRVPVVLTGRPHRQPASSSSEPSTGHTSHGTGVASTSAY